MDVERILQKVAALNGYIKNSLVKKSSQLTPFVAKIIDHINFGKMIYDANLGIEKPDQHWHQATILLQKAKETLASDVFSYILSDIESFAKPHKLERFKDEWAKLLGKDTDISLESKPSVAVASNIQNLLKAASYIEKTANDMVAAKIRLARLVDGHVGHIVGLIGKGQPDKAKEYLEVIRPRGWEQNAERNIDKLYEQVIRGLSEKLEPAAFQALGL
jgi:hypothetical protein